MNEQTLLWSLLFGSIGIGYLIYGRRQRRMVAWLAGLCLIGFPYIVEGTWTTVMVGVALLAAPALIKL